MINTNSNDNDSKHNNDNDASGSLSSFLSDAHNWAPEGANLEPKG